VDSSGSVVPDVSPFTNGRRNNIVAIAGNGRPFYQPDRNNFQPRAGIAWNVFGKGRTVLRAGYGIYFDRITQIVFTGVVTNTPYTVASNTANVPFRLAAGVPITPSATPAIAGMDPTTRNPYVQKFNATVEQQITRDTSISVGYAGALGRKLLGFGQYNGFGGVPQAARPDPRFSTTGIGGNLSSSRYSSLQISGKRRMAKGVDFTVAYTLAKSEDDVSFDFLSIPVLTNAGASAATGFQGGGDLFVSRSRRSDWGLSTFDLKHSFSVSHLVELPLGRGRWLLGNARGVTNALLGGWSFAGIAVLRSGEPMNITSGIDYNDDGDATNERPAISNGTLADLYTNGSLGRTQFLVNQAEAQKRLATPANVTDVFAQIPRNALRSPSVKVYDVSLIKHFTLTERAGLRFEANVFNIFNQVQFAAPITVLSDARFGLITGTRAGTNPRQIQFGLKLSY
jgi:hypothetical protein